jgi:hypothetical protein
VITTLKNLGWRRWRGLLVVGIVGGAVVALYAETDHAPWKTGIDWPKPKRVDPGPPGGPPSDAVVLFDGKDMSQWDGAEKWTVRDGYVVAGGRDIQTKRSFGDCQLHLEWASPAEVKGEGQNRGNSGVYFMGMYEVQVLDSYNNETYCDGQAGAVYKQRPPLVNVCRKPGEWQNYDIIFEAPRFDAQGKLRRPAYMTILQNGVLVQNHFELLGHTDWNSVPRYSPHEAKRPLLLQYHGHSVRFRNIWIRELGDDHENLLKKWRETHKSGE